MSIDHASQQNIAQAGFLERFEQQVARAHERTAVVFESTEWTYEALDLRANQIANHLVQLQVNAEQRVGICLDRSAEAIATMIGVMKAGAAFVPLDPEFPQERLSYIVKDAGIEHIICDPRYASRFAGESQAKILQSESISGSNANPGIEVKPHQLAYIMYTSGSTGKPKGVQIEHDALVTYCLADIDVYQLTEDDRTLQFSTLNFDIAVEEIFPPLLIGSAVVVRPRDRAASQIELSAIVEKYQVTAIHLATAYWHEWVDLMRAAHVRVPSCLNLMVVTGEKVSTAHYRRWLELCDHETLWCNAYGPTEATVSSTVFIPDAEWVGQSMPIGKALPGYTAYILDANGKKISGDTTGELFIGGPALARGYLNRPELNAASFPVLTVDGKQQRLYKSGDLARWLPNGDIEFAGRIDHQIKLGSYRIEPGEIEEAINQHRQVRESLIVVDENNGTKRLVAYVAHGDQRLEAADVGEFLKSRLPVYMRPARYVMLESFPKTINGKIDRDHLPRPDTAQTARRHQLVEPRTELEQELCRIWSDVLQVEQIGIHDDFFALGGSSLLVTRVIARIQSKLKQELPVRDFFANPTVATIASHIEAISNGKPRSARGGDGIRNRLPQIRPCFIKSGNERLFAVYYPPIIKSAAPQAVLICPPIGHEYQRSHRNLQQLAVQLSQAGHHVLRMDYTGTGNSSGSVPGRVDVWRSDIRVASEWLREQAPGSPLALVGLRFGAALAATSEVEDVAKLILWDAMDGPGQLRLLEEFHQFALTDFRRYNMEHRSASGGQLYGLPVSADLACELGATSFSIAQCSENVVAIRSASQSFPFDDEAQDVRDVATDDEIFWGQPKYAESAFSCPGAFREILNLL